VAGQESSGSSHAVVQCTGGAALLDLKDPRAAVWQEILNDFRESKELVYLETDSSTNVIKNILYPRSVLVSRIAPAPVENRHEVELEISQARHFLDTRNADYQQLLRALTVAQQQGTPVLVTETLDDHQIIDVRPDLAPFPVGPAMLVIPPAGPLGSLAPAAAAVTPQRAQQLFNLVASQPHIPFMYPDDGCWGRAHEMARLIIADGVQPRKIWIYGNLKVSTRNHPGCSVSWGWHVAPTLLVNTGSSTEIHVLDPALFQGPVQQSTWVGVQHDPAPKLHDTDATVFYRDAGGQLTYDPSYSQTQQVLERFRKVLKLRTAQYGPPPYSNCP
jgi:hypothetical protein